jgi:phosphoribosylglycinamide formyltransferase-1
LGILVSGRGSNLQAVIDAIARGELPAQIVLVVSNHSGVLAIGRAEENGIPVAVIERQQYPSRQSHHSAIAQALRAASVELVVLAGFDRVLEKGLISQFSGRIINVHPSLLPAFGGGLHAQAEAIAHGVKVSGCTVHFVTDDVDAGPIIVQSAVPVRDDDTAETLSARILVQEHLALPEAIKLIAEGRLSTDGRRVRRT